MTEDTGAEGEGGGHARDGALAALREVANDQEIAEAYPAAASSFTPADHEEIVRLAWSHQFDDDRSKFKRGIQALQEHLNEPMTARLELEE